MDDVTRQRVGSALRRMGEDLVAERRRVMLLTRENQQLREELERLRRLLPAGGGVAPESAAGSAPELVGQ
ncbi:MAG TPA: hypothetical protein VGH67_19035 [Solirubrobacteraceae bacterium]